MQVHKVGVMLLGELIYKNIKVEWFGHSCFKILTKDKIIYFDPYILPRNLQKADIIFVTHAHYDHFAIENIRKLIKDDGVVVATNSCAPKLANLNQKIVGPNERFEINGIAVETVPAYNMNEDFHRKADGGVGYVIIIDGVKIYHAGDTDFVPEMRKLKNIDIALLPIGGTYTMDEREAAEAANVIKPRIVVPMHFNTFNEIKKDPKEFKKLVMKDIDVKVL